VSLPSKFHLVNLFKYLPLFWGMGFLLTAWVFPASAQKLDVSLTKDMVLIPGGVFRRGCDRFGPQHGAPEQTVHLDSYWIDKYEVTNEKFEKYFSEHSLRRSIFSECDNCPVSKLNWYEAADYCHLIGKSLPSEAQWERAASNGDGCQFPWGEGFDLMNPPARGGVKLKDKATPVGSFSPNVNGLYDMAGNMWEWVGDWFSIEFYFTDILRNPRGPMRGLMKVRRGGSWSDSVVAMASGYRDWSYPLSRGFNDIGFRCAINLNIKGSKID
jgi:formylglycine-generating enzyme required for sulfatase activity